MSKARVRGLTGSRVTRRAGMKALVCMNCQRLVHGGNARIRTSFRGHSRARLDRHIEQVHTHPRSTTARPQLD